jgi:glycosyltransferase involved in cell wall biosynthesis
MSQAGAHVPVPLVSLLLPVYNQQDILGAVVDELESVLQAAGLDYEICLGENGSRDESFAVCQRLAAERPRVRAARAASKGYGSGILAALRIARGDVLAYLPSDGQVEPAELPELLRLVADSRANLVKGRRMTRENMMRAAISRAYNLLANVLFGVGSWDVNGPPKVFRRHLAERLDLRSTDSFIDVELLWKARRLGVGLLEAPVTNRERAGGRSSTSWRTVREFLLNMWRHRVGAPAAEWRTWERRISP